MKINTEESVSAIISKAIMNASYMGKWVTEIVLTPEELDRLYREVPNWETEMDFGSTKITKGES